MAIRTGTGPAALFGEESDQFIPSTSMLTKLSSHGSGARMLKMLSTASPLFQPDSRPSLLHALPWERGSNSPDLEIQESVLNHLEMPDLDGSRIYLLSYLLFYVRILPTGLAESPSEFI